MKKTLWLLLISCSLLISCNLKNLPIDPHDIAEIRMGTGINETKQIAAILIDNEMITEFMRDFTFSGERNYTVKHRLPAFVEFHLANGKVAHLRFENRLMRFNHSEYTLSETTAKSLNIHMKQDTF
jgi:hypothetical protein